jgi:hypothetical protein
LEESEDLLETAWWDVSSGASEATRGLSRDVGAEVPASFVKRMSCLGVMIRLICAGAESFEDEAESWIRRCRGVGRSRLDILEVD